MRFIPFRTNLTALRNAIQRDRYLFSDSIDFFSACIKSHAGKDRRSLFRPNTLHYVTIALERYPPIVVHETHMIAYRIYRWYRLTGHRASTSIRWHFAFAMCCHSNAARAPIANPPNTAQLWGTPYHSNKLHLGPCSSVGMRPRTDRHTDRRTWSLTIYISRRLRLTRNVLYFYLFINTKNKLLKWICMYNFPKRHRHQQQQLGIERVQACTR